MELNKTNLNKPSEAKQCVAMLLASLDYKQIRNSNTPNRPTMRSIVNSYLQGYDTNTLPINLFLSNPVHTLPVIVKTIKCKYSKSKEIESELKLIVDKYNLSFN